MTALPITPRLLTEKEAGGYCIASIRHTRREHRYITFWRPDDKGYAWPLPWAGRYSAERVLAELSYYNNGERSIAVRAEAAEALGEPPQSGDVDGDVGPVVRNTAANWKALLAGVIEQPADKPKPEYPRARRAA